MSFWWWRPRYTRIKEMYDDIVKDFPIKESNMYSYPVASYQMDVKCSKCGDDVKWHSVVFSREEADKEQDRIQAQYKKHLADFHASETNN